MRKPFTVEYKKNIFQFELDTKNGLIWLIQDDAIKSKSNNGQVVPARNLKEAKKIAEEMLYSLGY